MDRSFAAVLIIAAIIGGPIYFILSSCIFIPFGALYNFYLRLGDKSVKIN